MSSPPNAGGTVRSNTAAEIAPRCAEARPIDQPRFNLPIADRPAHGDVALPLLLGSAAEPSSGPQAGGIRQSEAESKFQAETSSELKPTGDSDLADKKARWITALLSTDRAG